MGHGTFLSNDGFHHVKKRQTHLRMGWVSLLRGTGMPPVVGVLGLGKPLLNAVVPAGLVRVVLLTLLAGLAELGAATGPSEELPCGGCVASGTELGPWVLNAFTGCLRARGEGAAGDRNLLGDGTGRAPKKEMSHVRYQSSKMAAA